MLYYFISEICKVPFLQQDPESYLEEYIKNIICPTNNMNMRKLPLFFMLLMTSIAYAQAIQVDVTTYSVPELVNTVLINSPCTSTSTIQWRTGSNFGSENGIGYFENTNPNFPMQKGIILSTGNAMSAPGPNISELNDGNNPSWIGDTDLENVLSQAGIVMQSTNATVLEFDFTPISSNFSFDFLFASEEYGNHQCIFSDAFAFLLTNKNTGVTTNLAVVPNTNTPISVLTIRDFLYNSLCESVNEQYFGSFNGGISANGSATNFNGQTVVMKATSVLIPNTPYHMKLVIADRSDYKSDSAIFISSNSLNLGQDILGEDLTVANNTAICFTQEKTLTTGLNPSEYSFSWSRNNTVLPGENGPDLRITTPGTYSVTYRSTTLPCDAPITDSIVVEYYPQVTAPNPSNLYKCNTGQATYDFNLDYNNPILLQGMPADTRISYHKSEEDAKNNLGSVSGLVQSGGSETYYARIQNNLGCFAIKPFQLLLITPPVAGQPADMTECAVSFNSTNGSFNFLRQNATVLNGAQESIYSINYYISLENAQQRVDPLTAGYQGTNGQTIYVRIENKTDTDCYDTKNFQIFVKGLPPVDTLQNVTKCEPYVLPPLTNGNYFSQSNGTGIAYFAGDLISKSQMVYIFNQSGGTPNCANQSSFRVTIIDPDEITPKDTEECAEYILPNLRYGGYFDQPGGLGNSIPAGTVLTGSQIVYVYFQFPESPFCIVDTNFSVRIIPFDYLPAFPNVFDCVSYELPPLAFGNYFDEAGGNGNLIPAGRTITSTQTIYVHNENGICKDDASFTVFIGLDPPQDATGCSSYTLPPLAVGKYFELPAGQGQEIPAGTVITSTKRIYVYIPTDTPSNCTDNISFLVDISDPFQTIPDDVVNCGGYLLPNLTIGNYFTGSGGTGTALAAGDLIDTTQRIYIYKPPLPGQICTNEINFLVTINPYPAIDSRGNIGPICKNTGYRLTPLSIGNYYYRSGGNPSDLIPDNTIITESTTIYIYATTLTDCAIESSFTIEVVGIEVDEPAPVITCDIYVLPPLNVGNYYDSPNGTGNQIAVGTPITETTTLYIYDEIVTRGLVCPDEYEFKITIAKTPVIQPLSLNDRTICDNDPLNNGFTAIDINRLSTAALGTNQSLDDYSVAFYSSEANALAQQNPITETGTQTIWIRISSKISNSCYDIEAVAMRVLKVPEPTPKGGIVCINSKTGALLKPYTIQSGLNAATHTFQWFNEAGAIAGATSSNYVARLPGFYTIIATSRTTGCSSNPATVEVKQSEPAVATIEISDAFDSNQTVTVTASGLGGDYIYQMDDGAFQESNSFYNVSSGNHMIIIRDRNGCEDTVVEAFVVNYPKFFTPNGDGINDTWNIKDLSFQKDAVINIFDRYGKFIIQIKPSGAGWNGTYNGQPHFANDYWFVVTYTERDVTKTFKAHFSLKR